MSQRKTGNPLAAFKSLKSMRKWIGAQGAHEADACATFCKRHGTDACPHKGELCENYELKVASLPAVALLSREFKTLTSVRNKK